MESKPKIEPHWGWYFLGPGLMLLGAGIGVAIWLNVQLGGPTVFPEWRLKHGEEISVQRSGELTVYLREDGERYASADEFQENFSYHLEPVGGGHSIRLEPVTGSESFTLGGAQWRAVYRVNFSTPGRYVVVGGPTIGRDAPVANDEPHRVRVGNYPEFFLPRLMTVVGIWAACALLCLVCTGVVALRRRANLRRARAMSPG